MLRVGQSVAGRFLRLQRGEFSASATLTDFARTPTSCVPSNSNGDARQNSSSQPAPSAGGPSPTGTGGTAADVSTVTQRRRGEAGGTCAYPSSPSFLQWNSSRLPSPAGFALSSCAVAAHGSRAMSTAATGKAAEGGEVLAAGTAADSVAKTNAASSAVENAQQAQPVIEASVPAVTELGMYPVDLAMRLIDLTATATGLPYWASIALITVSFRAVMLPLGIVTARNSARMAIIKPELDQLKKAMEEDTITPSARKQQRFQKEMRALFQKHDCKFSRGLWFPLAQIPFFASFWLALRRMGGYFPAYATGGALWFQDLSVADPHLALNIMTAVSFVYMIEKGADGMNTGNMSPKIRIAMRGVAGAMVPLTMEMPAGVFVYWLVSNGFSIAQTHAMKMPSVKKRFNIPTVPQEPPPGIDGEPISWIDVLGSSNPLKMHALMLDQQNKHSHSVVGGGDAGPVSDKAPLPPPPPVIRDVGYAAAVGKAGAGGAVSDGQVVLHTAPPPKNKVGGGQVGAGGNVKRKGDSFKKKKRKQRG